MYVSLSTPAAAAFNSFNFQPHRSNGNGILTVFPVNLEIQLCSDGLVSVLQLKELV